MVINTYAIRLIVRSRDFCTLQLVRDSQVLQNVIMFRPWLALSPISQYVLMVVAVCYYTSGFTRIFKFSKPNIFSHLLYGRKWVRIVPILSCICVCLVHCSFWSNKWARLTEPYTWLWLPYLFRQFSSTILPVSLSRILFPSSFNAKAQFVIPKKSTFLLFSHIWWIFFNLR